MTVRTRPILFNGDMVRAILSGQKLQTRRTLRTQPPANFMKGDVAPITSGSRWAISNSGFGEGKRSAWPPDPEPGILCPFGVPGDRLWVRETWAAHPLDEQEPPQRVLYRADGSNHFFPSTTTMERGPINLDHAPPGGWQPKRWRPSIHMPRWASRITLEVTRVWIERVQEISEADALDEGS